MKTRQIEVWFDETSDPDEPGFCVSLCEPDGSEIECLSTRWSKTSAKKEGMAQAASRGLSAYFRAKHGQLTPL